MDSITPVMRVILDKLDTLEDHETFDQFLLVLSLGFGKAALHAQAIAEAVNALVDCGMVAAERGSRYWEYSLTDAGCAARWALLKAETQARSRLRDFDASIPMRDGDVVPRVGAPAVHFESRAAMRQYLAGAQS